jgi:HEPN domain-containing protein
MNGTPRSTIEGWIDKASNQLDSARDHAKHFRTASEAIQAAQQCVELSVKSVLSLLDITYPPAHEWQPDGKPFRDIAKQIRTRRLLERLAAQHIDHSVRLPRLLFLMNLWARFYLTAKYGFEVEQLAPASELFERDEADLSIQHADECLRAARFVLYLDHEKLASLLPEHAA